MGHPPLILTIAGHAPVIATDAFLAPSCSLLGEVTVGARASVWYGTVVRADAGEVIVGAETNLQDGCVLHADPGFALTVGARVSVGHRAVLHGCTVADDVLVGMSATVLNGARIGPWCLIAAGAVVLQGADIPEGSLVAGVPAKVVRPLRDDERQMITLNAQAYLHLAEQHRAALT